MADVQTDERPAAAPDIIPTFPDPPSLTVPYLTAVVAALVSLGLTQGLITNGIAQVIGGLAAIFIPLVIVSVHAVVAMLGHRNQIHAVAIRTDAKLEREASSAREASLQTLSAEVSVPREVKLAEQDKADLVAEIRKSAPAPKPAPRVRPSRAGAAKPKGSAGGDG